MSSFLSLVSLIIIVNLISSPSLSQDIKCTNASQCVGDQLVTNGSGDVFGRGYKSISGTETSITSSDAVWCEGAFSCDSISFISAVGEIYCHGSHSCSNVSGSNVSFIEHSGSNTIHCHGSNSCSYSNLRSGGDIECDGDQSCAFSNIEGTQSIIAAGAYSLIYSVINSPGTGTTISISLSGYDSGFGSSITCKATDICYIDCYLNACSMTYLNCLGINGSNCIINKYVNPTTHPITYTLSFNLSYITMNNEQQCNQENDIKYDKHEEHKRGSDIIVTTDNAGSICCRGKASCYGVNNIQLNTTTKDAVVCSGRWGCLHADTINNNNGPVFCEGQASCYTYKLHVIRLFIITTNNVYCFGRSSCFRAIISNAHVFCSGRTSCQHTIIRSNGNNINLYLLGKKSGYNMTLYCNDTDNCSVFCGGLDACTAATFYGNVTIGYEFDQAINLSNDPIVDRTLNHIFDPTTHPTFSPTTNPIFDPTTDPKANLVLECDYYNFQVNDTYYTFNSYGRFYNVSIVPQIDNLDKMYSVASKSVIKQINGESEIYCDGDIEQTKCFIKCIGEKYCRSTKVVPKSKYLKELIIICQFRESCKKMEIDIDNTQNTQITKLTMLCHAQLSCDSVTIGILSQIDMEIDIHCDDNEAQELNNACQSMNIYINDNNNNNILDVTMTCYKESSCNDLFIDGNNVNNMNLTIIMYEYSDNVEIVYPKYEDIEFICNPPNQTHFIQLNEAKTESEIEALVKKQYRSDTFPCDGIVIGCPQHDLKCKIIYNAIQKNIDQLKYGSYIADVMESEDMCYWVDIAQLFNTSIQCPLFCFGESQLVSDNLANNVSILIVSGCIIIIIIGCIGCIWRLIKKDRKGVGLNIENPMVILLAIGSYQDNPTAPEMEGYCPDLPVTIDIKHLLRLFEKKLKYTCFPTYINPHIPKLEWTKEELMDLLKKQAKLLVENIVNPKQPERGGWDGLIVTISCHGMDNNIITSDYKLIRKDEIHRIFSAKYAVTREIPRVFMYDCCDGVEERKSINKGRKGDHETHVGKTTASNGNDPNTSTPPNDPNETRKTRSMSAVLWAKGTNNPDHKLALLHATNLGFQAKMNVKNGSYFLSEFVKKTESALEKNGNIPWIGDIFKEIQEELGGFKQLPTYTWNNETNRIKFKINKNNQKKTFNGLGQEIEMIKDYNTIKVEEEEDELSDLETESESLSLKYHKQHSDGYNKINTK